MDREKYEVYKANGTYPVKGRSSNVRPINLANSSWYILMTCSWDISSFSYFLSRRFWELSLPKGDSELYKTFNDSFVGDKITIYRILEYKNLAVKCFYLSGNEQHHSSTQRENCSKPNNLILSTYLRVIWRFTIVIATTIFNVLGLHHVTCLT